MPRWLPDRPIGICARCQQKFYLDELREDPNSPGLMVCLADTDLYDPYRLPQRKTEDVTLRRPRPDVSLELPAEEDE